MILEEDDNARWAAARYCNVIGDWIDAVLVSGDFDNVYPVKLPRTEEEAMKLKRKLDLLRSDIIPHLSDEHLEYSE
jgi:hypothetical protein